MNGWWRILVLMVALILGATGYFAVTGSAYAGRAELPYNPPNPQHIADPFEAALSCGAACDAYDRQHDLATQRQALAISEEKGCLKWSIRFERDTSGTNVSCRTRTDLARMLMTALGVCAALLLAGWSIGWVAAGFKRRR